jgi:hypothetical protein
VLERERVCQAVFLIPEPRGGHELGVREGEETSYLQPWENQDGSALWQEDSGCKGPEVGRGLRVAGNLSLAGVMRVGGWG